MGAPSPLGFRSDQTFFSFKAEDRPKLHDRLFDLIWAGEGRWDWDTIYNMPVFLRTFYIKKINKMYDQKKDLEAEQARKKAQKQFKPKIQKPPM